MSSPLAKLLGCCVSRHFLGTSTTCRRALTLAAALLSRKRYFYHHVTVSVRSGVVGRSQASERGWRNR